MNNFFSFCSELAFHRFDIRILAEQTTTFDAWPGAVLRNNLLYAAAQINIPEKGVTLFDYCNKQLPLSVSHPLYKEMENGFPPPFYLYPSTVGRGNASYRLGKNEVFHFSLVLIGEFSGYIPYFIEAIRYMCRRGMGVDRRPFTLIDVREISAGGEGRLLASGDEYLSDYLSFPMNMADFEPAIARKVATVRIVYESPVSLIKKRKKTEKAGFQEKGNGFPSFYQLVRSAAFRMEKLTALYHSPDDIAGYLASHEEVDDYVEEAATKVWLEAARLRQETHQSTRKEGADKRILLTGYTGEVTFNGLYSKYFPLLRCIEQLGVGEKLSYGFGKIRVEANPAKNTNELLKKEYMSDKQIRIKNIQGYYDEKI